MFFYQKRDNFALKGTWILGPFASTRPPFQAVKALCPLQTTPILGPFSTDAFPGLERKKQKNTLLPDFYSSLRATGTPEQPDSWPRRPPHVGPALAADLGTKWTTGRNGPPHEGQPQGLTLQSIPCVFIPDSSLLRIYHSLRIHSSFVISNS
jgi:hypothetical protein